MVCGSRHCCWKQRVCAPPSSVPRRLALVGRSQGGGYCRQLPGIRAEARAVPQQHMGIGGPRTSWRGCRTRGRKQFRRGSRGQGSRLQQQHNTSNTNKRRCHPRRRHSGYRWMRHSEGGFIALGQTKTFVCRLCASVTPSCVETSSSLPCHSHCTSLHMLSHCLPHQNPAGGHTVLVPRCDDMELLHHCLVASAASQCKRSFTLPTPPNPAGCHAVQAPRRASSSLPRGSRCISMQALFYTSYPTKSCRLPHCAGAMP